MASARRRVIIGCLSISLLLDGTAVALARPTIPETQVEMGDRQVFHVRSQGGCDGIPTDRLEVWIPESVVGVVPEAVPGWTVETEEVTTAPYELFGETLASRISKVRWLGTLPDEQFQDFGIAAVFRAAGPLLFPVLQGCGDMEVAWTTILAEGEEPADGDLPAPRLAVVEPTGVAEPLALEVEVQELRRALDELQARVDELTGVTVTPRPRRPRRTPRPAEATPAPTPRATRRPTLTPAPTTEPTDEETTAPIISPMPSLGTTGTGWPAGAQGTEDAPSHVGEIGTVCGTVVAAQYMPLRPGRPTFLNIDHPYPNQTFNVVIWGEQRRAFPLNRKPEVLMIGKVVCTTGLITAYRDWTQIAYARRQRTRIVQ